MLTILTSLGILPPATDEDLERTNARYSATWHTDRFGAPPATDLSDLTYWLILIGTPVVVFGGTFLLFWFDLWPGVK
jgi:hypothetical protein